MKIRDVRAVMLSSPIPEHRRWRSDYGTLVKADTTIVVVETDEGLTGYGAAQGTPPVVKALVEEHLRSLLLGEDPLEVERLWEKMFSASRAPSALQRGYSQPPLGGRRGETLCAISGVDIALWDILGKATGQPIYRLLGASRTRIRAYASGGWRPGEEAGEEMAGYVAKGFTAVKMRAHGMDGWSLETALRRVRAARRAIGDKVDLMVDAHGSLDFPSALRLAQALEEFNVFWLEEPVSPDQPTLMAEIRRRTSTPIAAGEALQTRWDFLPYLEGRAVDIVQPDVAICGGISEARRIASMASAFGVRYAPHVWYSGVLFLASLHLAASLPNCILFEVSQAHAPLIYEITQEPLPIKDGFVEVPQKPGLGIDLRPLAELERRFPYIPGPAYLPE